MIQILSCFSHLFQVYDGDKDSAPLFGRYCGDQLPDVLTSSGEDLLIRFKSDETINWKGFSAQYIITSPTERMVNNYDDEIYS